MNKRKDTRESVLTTHAYSGFPGAIPPRADLLFEVELKKIN